MMNALMETLKKWTTRKIEEPEEPIETQWTQVLLCSILAPFWFTASFRKELDDIKGHLHDDEHDAYFRADPDAIALFLGNHPQTQLRIVSVPMFYWVNSWFSIRCCG